jgi:predicted Zn-dependent protease
LFAEAQAEYLKGNWYDAEKTIQQLIAVRPRDVEAHLLLAAIMRHAHRRDDAVSTLDKLEQFDGASRWCWEINDERQRLA